MTVDFSAARPAEILLVEDDDADVKMIKASFKKSRLAVSLSRVENGKECLAFLRREEGFEDAPTPDLILLDLNMPLMSGREVMAEIAQDEELCHYPVVVLTTSDAHDDVLSMYQLRCSGYVQKPVDFHNFHETIMKVTDHWFTVLVLPPSKD